MATKAGRARRPGRSLILALCLVCAAAPAALGAPLSPPAPDAKKPAQSGLSVLSATDIAAYKAAFDSLRKGEFDAADLALEQIEDKCLVGYMGLERLLNPAYIAETQELKTWLASYSDHAGAERIAELLKAKPDITGGSGADPDASNPARKAFFAGRIDLAYDLAHKAQDRWIEGLAAFRLGRMPESRAAFASLSAQAGANEGLKSAAAFWASRAARAQGDNAAADGFLKVAAQSPLTLYGLIAQRRLGLDTVKADVAARDKGIASLASLIEKDQVADAAKARDLEKLVGSDARAKRAAALSQVGLFDLAGQEVKKVLDGLTDDAAKKRWKDLAEALSASIRETAAASAAAILRAEQYPTPNLEPEGGFTIDRALIYAIVKRESRFNPRARGGSAVGLMQITPATAAATTGDARFVHRPDLLKSPAVNLKVGQVYVAHLLSLTHGDLLQALAAYNTGPRGVVAAAQAMPGADSLTVLESLPGAGARDFVRHVAADYWIYSRLFNSSSASLDRAAADGSVKLADLRS